MLAFIAAYQFLGQAEQRAQLAHNLAREVMEGKWDETREESEAWFQREGKDLLRLHREAKP